MPKILIVGAGISGLALAYRLQQAGPDLDILVLEQRDRPGGTVWTEERNGFRIEIGANGFANTNPSTLTLCRDLGLENRLVAASEAAGRNRYLFLDGKLQPLPGTVVAFLRSGLLSWRGKLAFLAERFRPPRRNGAEESVAAFAQRRAGREVAEVFADALITGIHAGDPHLLSMRAAFPRLAAMEEQYGSIMKGLARSARRRRAEHVAAGQSPQGMRMFSFAQGLRVLIEALRDRLTRPPLVGVEVKRIEREGPTGSGGAGWVVTGESRDRWTADAVVLACPAYRQAGIVADLDMELAEKIGSIAYNRVAVVALGYRRQDIPCPVDGFGYIAPQRTRRDVLGVQWCSSIFPERAPEGTVLLRAMCGGWNRSEVAGWDDARLLEAVRSELRLAMGIESPPVLHHIVRWDRAIPQYHLGHLERVAWIEQRAARYPGLFLTGNAYHGVALNDCTEQGQILAAQIRRYLSLSNEPQASAPRSPEARG